MLGVFYSGSCNFKMKLNKYLFLISLSLFINNSALAQDNNSQTENLSSQVQSQNSQPVNNTVYPDNYKSPQAQPIEQNQQEVNTNQANTVNTQENASNQQPNAIINGNDNNQNTNQNNVTIGTTNETTSKNVSPTVVPSIVNSPKNFDWINNQATNLNKNGVFKMPEQVDYDSLVSQKDFATMLSKVTSIKDKSIFGDLDPQGFDKPLSRAMAIDSALRAFGLEKEMDKVVENYQTKFKDITPEHKYYKACLTAEIIKLSAGYPDKTFRPDDLLKWSEGVAIIESVYRWASLMPEQTPIQKAEDFRKNIWYYFIDGFRLILTSVYCLLSIVFLVRAWRRSKQDKTGLRPIIASLCFATAFLFIMWLNEMLYGRGIIEKAVYYIVSTVSILAGMFLIRTSNLINKQTEPKPKANIEVGYVDHIDMNRGEMFVIDSITKRRMLALISSDTKVYNKENRLLGTAFLSELSAGDFVSVKGTEQVAGGAMIDVDMILVLASKQANINTKQQKHIIEEQESTKTQARYRKVN